MSLCELGDEQVLVRVHDRFESLARMFCGVLVKAWMGVLPFVQRGRAMRIAIDREVDRLRKLAADIVFLVVQEILVRRDEELPRREVFHPVCQLQTIHARPKPIGVLWRVGKCTLHMILQCVVERLRPAVGAQVREVKAFGMVPGGLHPGERLPQKDQELHATNEIAVKITQDREESLRPVVRVPRWIDAEASGFGRKRNKPHCLRREVREEPAGRIPGADGSRARGKPLEPLFPLFLHACVSANIPIHHAVKEMKLLVVQFVVRAPNAGVNEL
mmetsp:Transcript_109725/g.309447  ORF Transcript_109725/g.309447 Transcript_109725/m.309447 type:complete len:274 (-) Transcript_109725:133-954(-)